MTATPVATAPAGVAAGRGAGRGAGRAPVVATARPAAAAAPDDASDRRLGWMVALGAALLAPGSVRVLAEQRGGYAPWWSLAAAALAVAPVVAVAAGPWLPTRVLRVLWRAYPLLSLAVLVTWTAARTGPAVGADTGPWVWQLEPAAVSFAALAWPFRTAVAYSQASALAVLAAALLADGRASRLLLVAVLVHLANVLFVAVLASIRRQLSAVRDAEAQLAARVAGLATARAREAEHARLAGIVHDEVLATLTLAARADGPPDASLVRQAHAALAAVRTEPADGATATVPGRRFTAELRERVLGGAPGAVLVVRAEPPPLPHAVADAALAALEEAVRNSVRHAGGGSPGRPVARSVVLEAGRDGLRITVRDDGVGFDPATVDPRRLGVRRSIVGRMAILPGGSAQVDSAPGTGTRVALEWRCP